MLQIKTISTRLDYASDFDDEVNEAIREGWTLSKRELVRPRVEGLHSMLYAELEKEVGDDEL